MRLREKFLTYFNLKILCYFFLLHLSILTIIFLDIFNSAFTSFFIAQFHIVFATCSIFSAEGCISPDILPIWSLSYGLFRSFPAPSFRVPS